MANELTVSASVQYEKSNHQESFTPDTQSITVSGVESVGGVQAVTTGAHETLVMNEMTVGNQGWAWFRNIGTSADASIQLGIVVSSNFHDVIELKGGEFAVLRLAGEQLFAKAVSSNGHLQFQILED